ncbi:hypothetical protein M8C21_016561 [Ambrosia artemisiifolia]|uniref:Pyrophosphate--fructose 6-phosphate 1-phosphotransferase subunit beta n=1 Tax=Ambrosia artemisiifolia TaxID=4212 RepID=A0AAD5GFX3_AMBAR|nr:hypothetical protein M8C21_016561 [Ambrosia artemisiifolia]
MAPPSFVTTNGADVTTVKPPSISRVSSVYSEVQNSRLDHPLALPSVFQKPFKVVDGPSSSAAGNPEEIAKLFPSLFGQPSAVLKPSESNEPGSALKIGVVLSGGQAPGGHNVISGMFDYLQERCKGSTLYGFRGGPAGIMKGKYVVLTPEYIYPYRNQGGFDMICSGRDKIETPEQANALNFYAVVRLMGRAASHITLECALQTHPNITLIGEEVASKKLTLKKVTNYIADVICKRADLGYNYGVILIPEGLIDFIPEVQQLIAELNEILAHETVDESGIWKQKLVPQSLQLFEYEGRCGLPSNFDSSYCYALGYGAGALLQSGKTGLISSVGNLAAPVAEWTVGGTPLTSLMDVERRHGKFKPVIKKAMVELDAFSINMFYPKMLINIGAPFKKFASKREEWALQNRYISPGPIQFTGPVADISNHTLLLELGVQV